MKRFTVLALAGLALAACQGRAPDVAPQEREAIEAAVRDLADEFLAAAQARDPDRAVALYSPDVRIFSNGIVFDRDGFTDLIREVFPTWARWEGGWTTTAVEVLTPTTALLTGEYHARITLVDEGVEAYPNVTYTGVYEYRDGRWWAVHVHQSYEPPEITG